MGMMGLWMWSECIAFECRGVLFRESGLAKKRYMYRFFCLTEDGMGGSDSGSLLVLNIFLLLPAIELNKNTCNTFFVAP